MRGFYWLMEGALAGCGRPGMSGAGRAAHGADGWEDTEAAARALDDDLAWLRGRGIGAVLSLTETPLTEGALTRHDLEGLHLPVDDLTAPTPEQLDRALGFIDRQRAHGRAVAVHCLVGQGRTGTVLAAYLIRGGLSPEQALRELRALSPGAVGSPEQERALRAFATRRDWIV
jgi:atypical dual specificity phosphatase